MNSHPSLCEFREWKQLEERWLAIAHKHADQFMWLGARSIRTHAKIGVWRCLRSRQADIWSENVFDDSFREIYTFCWESDEWWWIKSQLLRVPKMQASVFVMKGLAWHTQGADELSRNVCSSVYVCVCVYAFVCVWAEPIEYHKHSGDLFRTFSVCWILATWLDSGYCFTNIRSLCLPLLKYFIFKFLTCRCLPFGVPSLVCLVGAECGVPSVRPPVRPSIHTSIRLSFGSLIRSFAGLFIRSFIRLLVCSFDGSFRRSFCCFFCLDCV